MARSRRSRRTLTVVVLVVLSLSLIHGFMAADVPEMGTQMLAIGDGDAAKAAALARTLGLEIFGLRGRTAMPILDIDAGLDAALALVARRTGKPAVVADVWDNPGGGVAGDGTLILRRMLERAYPAAREASLVSLRMTGTPEFDADNTSGDSGTTPTTSRPRISFTSFTLIISPVKIAPFDIVRLNKIYFPLPFPLFEP